MTSPARASASAWASVVTEAPGLPGASTSRTRGPTVTTVFAGCIRCITPAEKMATRSTPATNATAPPTRKPLGEAATAAVAKRGPSTTTTVTLSLPPAIGGFDQFAHGASGSPALRSTTARDVCERRHLVAQAVAAQQQRAVGLERDALHLDEIGVVRRVLFADPTSRNTSLRRGCSHGLGFAQLAAVLALAHRRMVVRDLADLAAADLVQPRIAHVPHHRRAVLQHRHRQHAGHALPTPDCRAPPRRISLLAMVMASRTRCSTVPVCRSRRARTRLHRDLRRLLARGLPADAVHHQEDAALGVHVQASSLLRRTRPRSLAPADLIHRS
jgi:hypothetical protein